jgi:hypothetical protein
MSEHTRSAAAARIQKMARERDVAYVRTERE